MGIGLIGVDWGSTNLRAFRFAADGAVVETRTAPHGAAALAPDAFEPVLADVVRGWVGPATRIVLAGMVGGRAGWREAAYLPCPAAPDSLAGAALRIDAAIAPCFLVPGLSVRDTDGVAGVMRGEETQILGAGLADGTIVLPGTHSKWATVAGGCITGFRTAMTGELFALLRHHSLLGQLATADVDDADAFLRGVDRAAAGPIITLLFSARAGVLLGDLAPGAVGSYLSGLLIGGEVAALRGLADRGVTLVGNPALCARYAMALDRAGIGHQAIAGDDAVARGLWRIGALLP